MPGLLKITQEDIMRTLPPEIGVHVFNIKDFKEELNVKKSDGSGTHTKWTYDLEVVKSQENDAKNKGRFMQIYFYSSAAGFLYPFLAAVLDTTIEGLANLEIEQSKLVGKQVVGRVGEKVWQGKTSKEIQEYASAAQVPF